MTRGIWGKKRYFLTLFAGIALCVFSVKTFLDQVSADEDLGTENVSFISFTVIDDGREIPITTPFGLTVEEALAEYGFSLGADDTLFPNRETFVSSDLRVFLNRSKTISLALGEEDVRTIQTTASDIRTLLAETQTKLGGDDFVLPSEKAMLEDGMEIEVVRVTIRDETKTEAISYTTIETEDDNLGWRVRKVTKKGEKGEKELLYKVMYHNNKEIKRTLTNTRIVKEPITEEIVQGTYVELGKKHTGYGTWYAHTGTLAAASPWLPLGSYAKVTNVANGKSVMVVINDRGPFGENRIIDLDKVAFQKIASLGSGVIEVRVEEVKN